jgi:hypothetical protein
MSKLYTIFLFLLIYSTSIAQNDVWIYIPHCCSIDTTRQLALIIDVVSENDEFHYNYSLGHMEDLFEVFYPNGEGHKKSGIERINLMANPEIYPCNEYHQIYLPEEKKFIAKITNPISPLKAQFFSNNFEQDTTYSEVYLADISSLIINLPNVQKENRSQPFDLSQLEFLNDLQLDQFQYLSIRSAYNCNYLINLTNWPGYDKLVQNNTLRGLEITMPFVDDDFENQIKPFNSLRKLVLPKLSIQNINHFPHLQQLVCLNSETFFDQNLLSLPLTHFFQVSDNRVKNHFSLYPLKYFFQNELDIQLIGHPYFLFDTLISARILERNIKNGFVEFRASELYDYFIPSSIIATLIEDPIVASGEVKNGKPYGFWTFSDWFFDDHEELFPDVWLVPFEKLVPKHISDRKIKRGFKEFRFMDLYGEFIPNENFLLMQECNSNSVELNPIVASGKVRKGKPVGEWTYNKIDPYLYDFIQHHSSRYLVSQRALFQQNNDIFHNKFMSDTVVHYYYDYSKKGPLNFPENGQWAYFYPDGSIAIRGNFKDFKKDGAWKFYMPNGRLLSIQTFEDDLPNGALIIYGYEDNFVQFRYISENHIQYSFNGYLTSMSFNGRSGALSHYYTVSYDGIIEEMEFDKIINTYKKGTSEYDKILRENFLNLLYPDYEVGKTPYDLMEE